MHSDIIETNAQIENINKENLQVDINNVCDEQNEIFESEDEMRRSLSHLCYGDFYIIGRLWIEALKSVLIGSKFSLIPVVSAAIICPPQKPPPMKYTDLPLYKSPHYDYKDYIEDKKKCPKAKVKVLHELLLPKVKCFRKDFVKASCEAKCAVKNSICNFTNSINDSKKDFKKMMRDPNNLPLRQGVVLAGGVTGFLIGSRGGIPRKFFFTGLGLLSTGALCFPKETDKAFREFSYYSGKLALAIYNNLFGQGSFRERVPCQSDLPPPPLPRIPQCPPKMK